MNILLVAQCNKKALVETRRILDQFAERKGERTWQTAITLEGLHTLRKLLRKTARRNTAVACHWIKSANQTELVWIVGNLRRFNPQGAVPTNTTERDILKSQSENQWHSVETISLLAAIAGLFHDFGKANRLFQQGLHGKRKGPQPYRHEWVSLCLFCAWVGDKNDHEWLQALKQISEHDEKPMLAGLLQYLQVPFKNPFIHLPPLATTIAWLIVSHHRLPAYPKNGDYKPSLEHMESWLTGQLTADWNATHHIGADSKDKSDVWLFPQGTPIRSAQWRAKAQKFASRALQQASLSQFGVLEQRFTSHLARLVLMLADHHYSALPATVGWQDGSYSAYANTDRQTGQCKQKLDEHNIGVAQNALLLGRSLPHLRNTLPAITRHKGFKCRSKNEKYRWQDQAFDLTVAMRERTELQGFFGVNMASTGCGKTFANARIMYALADEKQGCRFSVALGLRTLTLQTGDALREKLTLQGDDLAVLVGSEAVRQLHDLAHKETEPFGTGSTSADPLFAGHQYIRYDGSLDDGRLSHWLMDPSRRDQSKLHKLLSAPVLVTTIDHLMGATEGVRGGKQIAPMLRLLTSDLVLDEPDDFDIEDLPALCRLVNWAGMLGSRVLLSSATLPPALVEALFNAYRAGRADYQQVYGTPGAPVNICCAWFDEQKEKPLAQDIQTAADFKKTHQDFVNRRVAHLARETILRRAQLCPVLPASQREKEVLDSVAAVLSEGMQQLHLAHHQEHASSGKTVSLGVIRMANIDPLVAVAQRLLCTPAPENYCIHYCVYHSQHPLAMRSHIEQQLDNTLNRNDPKALWHIPEISRVLESQQQHHLFVVLATSVAEVGRDHDYDWAIAEPSSMRSLIQLAGRIQRHRQQPCDSPNLYILQKNIKALKGHSPAYCRPGFESTKYLLNSHDLHEITLPEQYQEITAIPRVKERSSLVPTENFVDLEHISLRSKLQGNKRWPTSYYAARWWRQQATWCAEQQQRSPFRQSEPDERHYLWLEDEGDKPEFKFPDTGEGQWKQSFIFQAVEQEFAAGVTAWLNMDYQQVYQNLADELDMEFCEISQKFGEICLPKRDEERWCYHPFLGVFGVLE
jgi:CRISPR-associated endonuclease/helicase Cas3